MNQITYHLKHVCPYTHVLDKDKNNRTSLMLFQKHKEECKRKAGVQITYSIFERNNAWTLRYVSWLKQVKMQTMSGQDAFSNLISS